MSSSAAAARCLEAREAPGSRQKAISPGSAAWPNLVICLLLAAIAFAAYSPVRHNGFLNYDDDRYISDNPHVKAGLSWATVRWAFTTYDEANWAPLSWLSHALDYQIFGLNPAGHHFVSVGLHAANAVLLFLLLQGATGFRWRSLMVAALFALHPVNVESVAWAAERKNVLSMLFCLLALHAYTWYTRKPGLIPYTAVFFLLALGLLSKSQIITFPFLLLLWDYWPLGRWSNEGLSKGRSSVGWLALEKVPLFLLSAGSAMITMAAEKAGGAVHSQYSLLLRVETAVISYARYLGHALWPTKLVALYPHPMKLYPVWQVSAALLLLMAITVLVLRARGQRYLAVGWFWFLGTLVPMIGLVQVGPQAMADRFAYLPYIGLFVMTTWLAADWIDGWKIRGRWTEKSGIEKSWVEKSGIAASLTAAPAVCCLLVLGMLSYRQVGYWRDIPTFWRHTLAYSEGNYIAENNLGTYLFQQGKAEEGAAHFRAALAIRPDNLMANLNLGTYEDSRGNFPAAIERYEMVARHAPDVVMRAGAYGSLGFAYRQMGLAAKAKQCFEMALQLAPERIRPLIGLGLLAQESGDLGEAIRQYSQAVAVRPTDVGYFLLAQALQQAGRADESKTISARITNLEEARKAAESFLATGPPRA